MLKRPEDIGQVPFLLECSELERLSSCAIMHLAAVSVCVETYQPIMACSFPKDHMIGSTRCKVHAASGWIISETNIVRSIDCGQKIRLNALKVPAAVHVKRTSHTNFIWFIGFVQEDWLITLATSAEVNVRRSF